MNTASVLCQAFNETRSLTLYYFHKLKDTDIDQTFVVNGIELNSAKWLLAHVVWAENFLILEALGGNKQSVEWLNKVSYGSNTKSADLPNVEQIMADMNLVHDE